MTGRDPVRGPEIDRVEIVANTRKRGDRRDRNVVEGCEVIAESFGDIVPVSK